MAVFGFPLAHEYYSGIHNVTGTECFGNITHKDLGMLIGFMSLFLVIFGLLGIVAEIRAGNVLKRVLAVSFHVLVPDCSNPDR